MPKRVEYADLLDAERRCLDALEAIARHLRDESFDHDALAAFLKDAERA